MNGRGLALIALILAGTAGYFALELSPEEAAVEAGQTLGEGMVEVHVPDRMTEAALAGQAQFDRFCAQCHGLSAAGIEGVGPPLVHEIYEPSHHGDIAFAIAAANGTRQHHWGFGDMPPVEGIRPEELNDIVAYVRELQRANGID